MDKTSLVTLRHQPHEISRRLYQIEIEISLFDVDASAGSQKILTSMDEVALLIAGSWDQPGSLKAERSQFEAIKAALVRRASRIVKAAGGDQSYRQQREQRQPPAENEWWYLDDILRARRNASFRKTMVWLAGGVLFLIVLTLVYLRFLAPDPKLIAKLDHQNAAVEALVDHQNQQALNEANLALSYDPRDLESLVLKGMALTKSGQIDEANQVFLVAQNSANGMAEFYQVRSQGWLSVNEPGLALDDAQKAIGFDPKNIEGFWYKGKAEIILGKYVAAEDDLNQAIDLANQQNHMILLVQIKGDLANLMQVMQ